MYFIYFCLYVVESSVVWLMYLFILWKFQFPQHLQCECVCVFSFFENSIGGQPEWTLDSESWRPTKRWRRQTLQKLCFGEDTHCKNYILASFFAQTHKSSKMISRKHINPRGWLRANSYFLWLVAKDTTRARKCWYFPSLVAKDTPRGRKYCYSLWLVAKNTSRARNATLAIKNEKSDRGPERTGAIRMNSKASDADRRLDFDARVLRLSLLK